MAREPALRSDATDTSAATMRATAVCEQMRADITQGVLAPGSKRRVQAMSQRHGVGASPLREALNRLSAEGQVDRTDQRGFSVALLLRDELPLLTQTRLQLESLAAPTMPCACWASTTGARRPWWPARRRK